MRETNQPRLPQHAVGRYRLVIDHVTRKRAEVGLYAAGGRCDLVAGVDVWKWELPAAVRRLVRQADAARGGDDPVAAAAQIAELAERLAGLAADGPVDRASVAAHLADAQASLAALEETL